MFSVSCSPVSSTACDWAAAMTSARKAVGCMEICDKLAARLELCALRCTDRMFVPSNVIRCPELDMSSGILPVSGSVFSCSCKSTMPKRLEASPQHPTTRIRIGLETSWGSANRCIASRKIDMQRATRKTPLISAPSVSARCHWEMAVQHCESHGDSEHRKRTP